MIARLFHPRHCRCRRCKPPLLAAGPILSARALALSIIAIDAAFALGGLTH